jgi:hypothetical protein
MWDHAVSSSRIIKDLDAELHRLLPGALGQIGAVDALREAHVVFELAAAIPFGRELDP